MTLVCWRVWSHEDNMRSVALDDQLRQLAQRAHEYRRQAIVLDAKLRLRGLDRLRVALLETSVLLDGAVASLLR